MIVNVLHVPDYGALTLIDDMATLGWIAAVWSAVSLIPYKNVKFTQLLVAMSGASFGIYIFHNWVEMNLLSTTAQRLLPLEITAIEHPVLFPLLFCLIALVVSYLLTLLLLKTRFGRRLIG